MRKLKEDPKNKTSQGFKVDRNFVINKSYQDNKAMRQTSYEKHEMPLIPGERRTKGYIDFDLQIDRPELKKANAHDLRFENFDVFPKNYSNTRNPQAHNFSHYLPRNDNAYMFNMSDALFDRDKHLNLYKPKPKGILQFSKALSKNNEWQIPAVITKKEKKQSALYMIMLNNQLQEDEMRNTREKFNKAKAPIFDKQFPRTNDKTEDLPLYMQVIPLSCY